MKNLSRGLHERLFDCDGDAIFSKLSRCQRAMKIAHVATLPLVMRQTKKSQKKNREKFSELNFLRQNHGLWSEGGYDFRPALEMRQFQKKRITIALRNPILTYQFIVQCKTCLQIL